jgi:peptide/nickel transport system permease protein
MSTGITTALSETPLAGAAPQPRRSPVRSRALRLPRSPKVIAGLAILALFAVIAVIGPMIAPYSPNETGVYCRTACSGAQAAAAWLQTIVVHPAEQVCNTAGICFGSPAVLAFVPKPPSSAHWLGTTVFAQDVWSQLLASTRATLLVGFIAGAIATALSVLVGVTAGYLGGNADEGLSLLSNVFLAIPGLPLLIVLASYVPSAGANVIIIALIVAATGWAYGARVLRAQTLSLRNRDFVEAARVSGEGRMRIIVVEVLPNLLPIVASTFLFTTLYAVGAYVALAFLGLAGAPNATPAGLWNWGEMLQQAYPQNAVASGWWWWWLPPGFCIALLGMGLALLNFGIDEFVNPRLRAAGLSRRSARRAGISFRPRLGITPVMHRRGTVAQQPATAGAAADGGGAQGPPT